MAENVLNSLRDKGLLSNDMQEKLLHLLPEDSKEKLSTFFQRYQQLNEQEKHELLDNVVGKFKQTLEDRIYNNTSIYQRFLYFNPYTVFFFALLLVVLVLGTFIFGLG
nr:PREDICTED: uncharacterized protein LOC105662719 [Megachile rotundata]